MIRQNSFDGLVLPTRVLMTADTVGGIWNYALELCGELARFGIEVALATMGAPLSPAQQAEAARSPNTRLFQSRYKLEWMDSPWCDVAAAGSWLLDLDRHFQPDLIHFNGYAHASLPWEVPTVVVAHSCVLSWWQAVKYEPAPAEWNKYRDVVRAGLNAAELVVAPSRAMLHSLEEHYGRLACTRVIPNGRRIVAGPSQPKDELILSAGRLWDEAKNVVVLNDIAPLLPWPVCIAGDCKGPMGAKSAAGPACAWTEEASDFRKPAQLCGTEEPRGHRIRYLGQLTSVEIAAWQNRAAIYVSPARYEPFGLSILEAALAGCALVLGDIPTIREIWADTAIFVPPNDRGALKDALELLISDKQMREALAEKSLRRASTFTPERMANSYIAAYSQLLSERIEPCRRQPGPLAPRGLTQQEELPCV